MARLEATETDGQHRYRPAFDTVRLATVLAAHSRPGEELGDILDRLRHRGETHSETIERLSH